MRYLDVVRNIARRAGYDIRRAGDHIYKRPIDFINSRNIDLVLDVGANIGQYGASLRKGGYAGTIVSFEPMLAAYQELAARSKDDNRWIIFNMAIGAKDGTASINVSKSSDFSSILKQTAEATRFDPNAEAVGSEAVTVAKLDNIFHTLPPSNAAFLKIDTQGYEQQVLFGASKCLPAFLGVQMEMSLIHLYEGTWQFHEAVKYMSDIGFEISNIIPVNYDHEDTASLVEIDCVFRSTSRGRANTSATVAR